MPLPDDAHRCTWTKNSGRRCGSARSEDGGDLCHFHVKMREDRIRIATLAESEPDRTIEEHLRLQLRASYVAVRLTELEMHDLGYDREAFLHKLRETEERDGGPGGGYRSVKRARQLGAHPLMVQYLQERAHHLQVVKVCVAAGLAARQVQAVERFVEHMLAFATTFAEELGHDPGDPDVRQRTLTALRRMEDQMRETPPPTRGALES